MAASDVTVLAGTLALLISAAAVAIFVPAKRAAATDPVTSLREN